MDDIKLKTKREHDIYIQALKDAKKIIDMQFKSTIEYFESSKDFCDDE